ncbi:MAG: thioredoxin family protein [Candidatus Thermoplasmatota archaeon]|nr:thioredoxin family protein [Candidatus Thermoplasmatota archaeon]
MKEGKKALETALAKKGVTVLYFSALWCGPCKGFAPVMEKLAREYDGRDNVEFVKVDVDEMLEVAEDCGITGVPAVAVMLKGRMVRRFVGATEEWEIKEAVERALEAWDKR